MDLTQKLIVNRDEISRMLTRLKKEGLISKKQDHRKLNIYRLKKGGVRSWTKLLNEAEKKQINVI